MPTTLRLVMAPLFQKGHSYGLQCSSSPPKQQAYRPKDLRSQVLDIQNFDVVECDDQLEEPSCVAKFCTTLCGDGSQTPLLMTGSTPWCKQWTS